MPAEIESSFDVALWFLDRALGEQEYLQPQKLQRLLYLAQAYYAVANPGRKLMPAVFVAAEMGPTEPSVYHALATGRPYIEARPLPEKVVLFLDGIWRRFGSHSADYLTRQLKLHSPYVEALRRGDRAEITLQSMMAFYGRAPHPPERAAPPVEQVLRSRMLQSHTGRPVAVRKWIPPTKTVEKE